MALTHETRVRVPVAESYVYVFSQSHNRLQCARNYTVVFGGKVMDVHVSAVAWLVRMLCAAV